MFLLWLVDFQFVVMRIVLELCATTPSVVLVMVSITHHIALALLILRTDQVTYHTVGYQAKWRVQIAYSS